MVRWPKRLVAHQKAVIELTATPTRKESRLAKAAKSDFAGDAPFAGTDQPERADLGERLRTIRQSRNWTLDEASKRTLVGRSTLSKIENGLMSPTFDLLRKITRGMNIDLVELFDERREELEPRGRRSITRKGEGKPHRTPTYLHELLATDISNKRMLPFKSRITARSVDEFGEWVRHDGEEILVVTSGTVEVHTEYYSPAILQEGDSVYFDSRMGHCVISVGTADAEVLWICSGVPL